MITVFNGEILTSTATEDEVLFVEKDGNGNTVPAGRNLYTFTLKTGSVQMAVGKSVDTSKAATWSTAGDKWLHTINNNGYAPGGPQEGNNDNLRVVGVATVAVTW